MLEDLRAIADEQLKELVADEAMRNRFLAACGAQSVIPKKVNGAFSASITSIIALSIMVILLLSARAPRSAGTGSPESMLDVLISQIAPQTADPALLSLSPLPSMAQDIASMLSTSPSVATPPPSAAPGGAMSDPPATQVDTVRPFSAPIAQAMYPVKIAGKYGYMDAMGSLVIAPQYDEASLFFEGVARASVLTEEGPRYALIFDDAANTEPDFAFIGDFDEMGMAPALYADTSMWGYINQAGQWLISPDFNQAEPFLGDRALVTYQEQEGSIDREGVFASLEELPPVLPTASAAPAEWPGLDPQRSLVFVSGENVVFSDRSNSLMGVADAQGETLIPSMYTTLMAAPNGGFLYGIVDSSGRLCYGLLSQDGAVVIPHAYRYLAPCPGDGAYIAQPVGNTGYGLLDEHSAWILEPEYVSIYYYDGILASVEKTDPMGISVRGYVNRQGEWVRVQNE